MTIAFNLDSIVAEGYLAAGVKPSVIAARSNAGRDLVKRLNMSGRARVAPNINKWSKQDDDFMRAHYRYMTDEEVGQAMGRSAVAVVIRRKRLGLPAPSKHPDELTATAIKHLLGVDEHAICSWIDSGILRARLMPGARKIRLVKRIDFLLWCINPESWLRFKVDQVRDPKLKRMIEMRMARWGDEWWTTRQVADYHDIDIRLVNARINRKTLRHVKPFNISGRHNAPAWSYNFVRKSDALGMVFTQGKGSASTLASKIAPALEQFIEQSIGAGVPQVCVAEMIGWTSKRLSHWVRRYKGGAKALRFVDWRTVKHLPFVRRAVERFHAGRDLNYDERLALWGILNAWNKHYSCEPRIGLSSNITHDRIVTAWRQMVKASKGRIDPFKVV